jgi:uncharacterized protein (DUF1778 family)
MAGTKGKKARRRRPGAGRKPLGKLRVNFKLKPETNQLIERRAAKAQISRSEYVERVILDAADH